MISRENILFVMDEIGCGEKVATELLLLAANDADLVVACSRVSSGLDQCKVHIIDARFRKLEQSRKGFPNE